MKISPLCLAAQLTALAASHLFAGVAAVNLTWDGNTALPPLQDGGGSWTTNATDRWSNGGGYQAWGTALPPNNAIFGIGTGAAAPVTVDGAITVGNVTFNAALTGNYDIAPGSGTLSLASPSSSAITTNAAATISANIGGTGPLIKAGTAALTLSGANNFTGVINVSNGALIAASNGALPTTTLTTAVNVAAGAQLQINGGVTVNLSRTASIAGTGLSSDGALLFMGAAARMQGGATVSGGASIGANAGTTSTPNRIGAILGSGGWTKVGAGALQMESTGGNGYTGDVTVAAGTLLTRSNAGAFAITEGLTINSGAIFGLQNSDQIAHGSDVVVHGTFDLNAQPTGSNDFFTTINSLNGDGVVKVTNAVLNNALLRISSTTTDSTFSGSIQGIVNVQKSGAGTSFTLSGTNNTYSGVTELDAGTFRVTGSIANSALDIRGGAFVIDGAVTGPVDVSRDGSLLVNGTLSTTGITFGNLLGSGNVFGGSGTITGTGGIALQWTGAHLAPGNNGVGQLTFNLGASKLDLSGITFDPDGLRFELGSVGASDRVKLNSGTLDLSTLDFGAFNFTTLPGFGQGTYLLFDTTSPILGDFSGNLGGTINGMPATLSLAESGHDLVLTVVPEPSSVLLLLGSLLPLLNRRPAHRKRRYGQ